MKKINLQGKKFGRLIVINQTKNKNRMVMWKCLCRCGNVKDIPSTNLIKGLSQSCGCIHKEQLIKRNYKHGMSNTRINNIWQGIKQRCLNKNDWHYIRWGGRGIKICNRWLKFENFRDDMYEGYLEHVKKYGKKNTQIDRIDNNGNYSKENCRWATLKEQANNTRSKKYYTYKGEMMTLRELAKKINLNYETLRSRIYKSKWSLERAFNTKKL